MGATTAASGWRVTKAPFHKAQGLYIGPLFLPSGSAAASASGDVAHRIEVEPQALGGPKSFLVQPRGDLLVLERRQQFADAIHDRTRGFRGPGPYGQSWHR